MRIEKLPSGSYRIRKMVDGKRYTLVFDHKPSQKEIAIILSDRMQDNDYCANSATFSASLDDYIHAKSNVLSPSTIRGYKQLKGMYSDQFKNMNVYDITNEDIQDEVNDYAADHSPKSVRNFYGLIKAVMGLKRPSMNICATLPQKAVIEAKIPTHEDVTKVLNALEGTRYHIPIQLACLGLRKSEICALTLADLDGNTLTIDKALVLDADNKHIIKSTKTVSGTRKIYIPDKLVEEIQKQGYIYEGYPNNIIRALHRTQDALGLSRCKLHELRHFYVSYAHSMGMSDADIIASIGHSTDDIMKRVYRHAMNSESEQERIALKIL